MHTSPVVIAGDNGYNAYMNAQPFDSNPHGSVHMDEHMAWSKGWRQAEKNWTKWLKDNGYPMQSPGVRPLVRA